MLLCSFEATQFSVIMTKDQVFFCNYCYFKLCKIIIPLVVGTQKP